MLRYRVNGLTSLQQVLLCPNTFTNGQILAFSFVGTWFFTFMLRCIVTNFFITKPSSCTNSTNLFWHETLHFRTVPLSIIRSLSTVHSAMVYVIQTLYTQISNKTRMELQFHPGPARKLCVQCLYDILVPLLSLRLINSWWWTEELSETCKFSCQNKFVKLVHLVGFSVKK
jgi:hypothetical protein